MSECIFCEIINGKSPARKIFEDRDAIAFLDLKPVRPGHVIVMLKEHTSDMTELDEDRAGRLFSIVQKVAKHVVDKLGAYGFNVLVNAGSAAGQEVFHTHAHVIPRMQGDELMKWPKVSMSESELDEMAKTLKKGLS